MSGIPGILVFQHRFHQQCDLPSTAVSNFPLTNKPAPKAGTQTIFFTLLVATGWLMQSLKKTSERKLLKIIKAHNGAKIIESLKCLLLVSWVLCYWLLSPEPWWLSFYSELIWCVHPGVSILWNLEVSWGCISDHMDQELLQYLELGRFSVQRWCACLACISFEASRYLLMT